MTFSAAAFGIFRNICMRYAARQTTKLIIGSVNLAYWSYWSTCTNRASLPLHSACPVHVTNCRTNSFRKPKINGKVALRATCRQVLRSKG